MKKIIVLLATTLLFSTTSYAQEIPKSNWINYMQNALPGTLCQESQYFRKCFNISGNKCLQIARSVTNSCLNKEKNNLPDTLNSVTGEQWGNIIGSCAGTEYEKKVSNKKSKDPKCYDPSNWM